MLPEKKLTPATPPAEESPDGLTRVRQQLGAELTPALGNMDRLVTLLRVYPLGHPLVDQFATQLAAKLAKLAERFGAIELTVTADAIASEWGDLLWDARRSERGHFLWFQAFSEGLSGFIIHDDLDADELQRFMQLVNRCDLRQLPTDDDIITLAWEARLEAIEIISSPGAAAATVCGALGALPEHQVHAQLVDAAITPATKAARALHTHARTLPALDSFTQHHLQQTIAGAGGGRAPLGAEQIAEALRVDPSWIERVSAEWQHGADLEYRLIEALISILRTSPGTPQAAMAAETILTLATQLFEEQNWTALASQIRLLRARQADLARSQHKPLDEVIAFISTPARLETLLYQVQRARADHVMLSDLLVTLDADLVQRQLLGALADGKRELRAVNVLVDILIRVTTPATMNALREAKLLDSPFYLTRMMDGLAGRKLGTLAPTIAQLYCAALTHDLIDLRRAALLAYTHEWGTQSILDNQVRQLADDSDEQIRQLALDLLRRERPQVFLDLLDELVEGGHIAHRSPGEVRYLVRQYMELRPGGEAKLRGLIDTNGWFSSERRELARGVAAVLIEYGDAKTIAAITEQARSLWTYPKLRLEYRRLLERIQLEQREAKDEEPS
jgi:hypothetical protein